MFCVFALKLHADHLFLVILLYDLMKFNVLCNSLFFFYVIVSGKIIHLKRNNIGEVYNSYLIM